MPIAQSAQIHATAVVSPEADIADGVQVGPYAVIEGKVVLGQDCVLRPGAYLIGPITMGRNNTVYSGAILGEAPQHLKYENEPTWLEIGDHNIFRENVTIHRGTKVSWATRIGSHNFFMAGSHVAHDCRVGNNCIFANGAVVGGHCTVEDNVYLSGNCAVHQFVRLGRLSLLSGVSATTKDIPPFIIQQRINAIVGVNVVGMRRAGISNTGIEAVRQGFALLFRSQGILTPALAQVEKQLGHVAEVAEMIAFIRASTRGICFGQRHVDAA
jgi:UDP-N-acetylglucosamine acyltransferase